MPRKKNEIDESLLCEEYVNTNIGIEALAKQFHIGKKRAKEILRNNSIEFKSVGGQTNREEVRRYQINSTKYDKNWVLIDKTTSFQTKDVYNKAGVVTSYINKQYGVEIPSLYDRTKYYEINGVYWWEQWLTYEKIEQPVDKKCPYCDWETIDIANKSGAFRAHIENYHKISMENHLKLFPDDKKYFSSTTQKVPSPDCKQGVKVTDETVSSSCNYMAMDTSSKTVVNELYDYIENSLKLVCEKDCSIFDGENVSIYVPSKKVGIVYNNLKFNTEWFGGKGKHYHLNKLERCRNKGISLLQVFEDEYVQNKEVVFEKIKHILGFRENKPQIYGRKCEIRVVDKEEGKQFLNKYHIQGDANSKVMYGAYYEGKLIAVMSFIFNTGIWELNRFASDYHYICAGVGGKLFKKFVKDYNPETIKSFADRRWTIDYENNIYVQLGFKFDSFVNPDYMYYNENDDPYRRYHKFGFRIHTLNKKYGLPLTMTEREMVKEIGYDRVWNCGLIKYVWERENGAK